MLNEKMDIREQIMKEYGVIEQICDKTEDCTDPDKNCAECAHYHETWDLIAYINGLEWILKENKFGFGENWKPGMKPANKAENAGYIIQRTLDYLNEEREKLCANT